ncbi:HTTM domain-containing protein [Apibacter raozihei]|uniref:HTTM domain-containing protein n=1 Tax=Apibacter raozihei TaxID=2500547 RepID=UPI000FE2DB3E|nr:HTTM domain-containing protein [Apibacter raozihei]
MKFFSKKLFLEIDNSSLIVFRIFFGFLLTAETWGAILTGWVKNNFITPKVFFPFIGFEWLHPLPGNGMYYYFIVMGILGLMVMVGYYYRISLFFFTLLWTSQYLMQKTAYNNHYYFLILICSLMLFLPANAYCSLDSKKNKRLRSYTMPQWCSVLLIFQAAILYFYATLAKIYPDWLDGTFTRLLYSDKTDFPIIGKYFTEKWFYLPVAYLGILFDGLVIPLLLWKKTRTFALLANLIFHLSNSFILQVGIFPYLALSFVIFVYPPLTIKKIFFRKRPWVSNENYSSYKPRYFYYLFGVYFLIQLFLPLRHYFIKGDVFWTEEGHRLSWRMMLRQKSGNTHYKVIDKSTKETIPFNLYDLLTDKQVYKANCYPDYIWQTAQYIKHEFYKKGIIVDIYADSFISVNGHPFHRFIDPDVNLAEADWNYFFHNNWILLYNNYME